MAEYVIISLTEKDDETGADLFWSNEYGWTPFNDADRFSEEERQTFTLPQGASWRSWAQEAGMQRYLNNIKRTMGELGGV